MAILIDGKALAAKIKAQLVEEAKTLPRRPGLAVILVGNDPASRIYVTNKEKDCEQCGFLSYEYKLPEETSQEELLDMETKSTFCNFSFPCGEVLLCL